MPTVETIRVEFVADTRDLDRKLRAAGRVVDRTSKSQKKLGTTTTSTNRAMRNFGSSVVLINGPLSGLGARAAALNSIIGRSGLIMAGVAAVSTVLSVALLKTSQAAAQHERQMGRVGAILKATGAASRLTSQDIDQQAQSLGRGTLESRKSVLDASAALLTFKSISGEVFRDTLSLATDVSEVLGTNLRSSVVQLAKALARHMPEESGLEVSCFTNSVIVCWDGFSNSGRCLPG